MLCSHAKLEVRSGLGDGGVACLNASVRFGRSEASDEARRSIFRHVCEPGACVPNRRALLRPGPEAAGSTLYYPTPREDPEDPQPVEEPPQGKDDLPVPPQPAHVRDLS